jgi:hypothetical protein
MNKENKISSTSIRVPPELHKPIRRKMVEEDIRSFSQLVVGLVKNWLAGGRSTEGVARSEREAYYSRNYIASNEVLSYINVINKSLMQISSNLSDLREAIDKNTDSGLGDHPHGNSIASPSATGADDLSRQVALNDQAIDKSRGVIRDTAPDSTADRESHKRDAARGRQSKGGTA